MPGYLCVVFMFARVAYQLHSAGEKVVYGPSGLGRWLQSCGARYSCWPSGCFTLASTAAQYWRFYELFYTFHPWHAVPYGHDSYRRASFLGEAIDEWQGAFFHLHGHTMAQTPREVCDTTGLVDLFVRPMSDNTFRLSYVMSNYELGCDFYTRFSTDQPGDSYQHMHASIREPDQWWTLTAEPTATRRTMEISRDAWHYVPPRLQDLRVARL